MERTQILDLMVRAPGDDDRCFQAIVITHSSRS